MQLQEAFEWHVLIIDMKLSNVLCKYLPHLPDAGIICRPFSYFHSDLPRPIARHSRFHIYNYSCFTTQGNLVSFSYYTVGIRIHERNYDSCFNIQEKNVLHTCVLLQLFFYNQENLVSFSYYTVGVHIYETHFYSCFYIEEKHLMHTYVYMNIIFYFQYIIIIS